MSEMEAHKGKLIPMALQGEDLEERAFLACLELDYPWADDTYESWLECLQDQGYKSVYIDEEHEVIYRIENKELDSCGFVEGELHEDGSIDYFVSYYNGGASFDEVMESVVKDVIK